MAAHPVIGPGAYARLEPPDVFVMHRLLKPAAYPDPPVQRVASSRRVAG